MDRVSCQASTNFTLEGRVHLVSVTLKVDNRGNKLPALALCLRASPQRTNNFLRCREKSQSKETAQSLGEKAGAEKTRSRAAFCVSNWTHASWGRNCVPRNRVISKMRTRPEVSLLLSAPQMDSSARQ